MILNSCFNTLPQQVEENRRKILELEERGIFECVNANVKAAEWVLSDNRYVYSVSIPAVTSDTMIIVSLDDSGGASQAIFDAYTSVNQCRSIEGGIQLICLYDKPMVDFTINVYYNI